MQTTHIDELREIIEASLSSLEFPNSPKKLYEPMGYILSLGGKRIRPVLTLLSAELFGITHKDALNQALAIEVFHNFTLVHDDIMDRADLRRNTPTVHKKWDDNVAILSGDGMLVYAYQLLAKSEPRHVAPLLEVFSKTAMEVCEGQQLDMDLAQKQDVQMPEYLEMIRLKTAVLLTCSMQMGAILADASKGEFSKLKDFAENIGLAFQIRDDYLDAFGDQQNFGKKIGGDILEGKRTWLTVKAFELASEQQKKELTNLYNAPANQDRVERVLSVYRDLQIDRLANDEINAMSKKAMESLEAVDGSESVKKMLKGLVAYLMGRTK